MEDKNKEDKALSVEDLKNEYIKAKNAVKTLKTKMDQKRGEPTSEEKKDLRVAYTHAADIAKKLASRSDDPDLIAAYKKDADKLTKCAQKWGSTVSAKIPTTTLDDVKGLKNVKENIENFIFIARNPEIMKQYKLKGGLGMLMYGPPGTGKTLIAEAVANAMQVPFFLVTPADIFKPYVGESEEAVKMLFEEISECKEGCVLFIDECESIFSRRTSETKDYKSAVTTELLQRMNGFGVDGDKRVMIAATNRPEIIDPAYLRFKRFSTLVLVDLPDEEAKRAIIHSKIPPVGLANDVTEEDIVRLACVPGKNYSAADICGVIEAACMNAIKKMRDEKLENPVPLTREMLETAFSSYPVKITDKVLEEYRNFKVE